MDCLRTSVMCSMTSRYTCSVHTTARRLMSFGLTLMNHATAATSSTRRLFGADSRRVPREIRRLLRKLRFPTPRDNYDCNLSRLGNAIPDHFANPGISGLSLLNPGINPGIESIQIMAGYSWLVIGKNSNNKDYKV